MIVRRLAAAAIAYLGLFLVVAEAGEAATPHIQHVESSACSAAASILESCWEEGCLRVEIDHASLKEVLDELTRETGLEVRITDPHVVDWPISGSLTATPFREGLREILDGLSYALFAQNGRFVLLILSSNRVPNQKSIGGINKTGKLDRSLAAIAESADSGMSRPSHQRREARSEIPQSLEDFRALQLKGDLVDAGNNDNADFDEETVVLSNQAKQDTLVQRALDVLRTEYRHLYSDALDQLADIADPNAVAALVEIAVGNFGVDTQLQTHAANAALA